MGAFTTSHTSTISSTRRCTHRLRFTVRDNKDWHTATFRLEDPQFVNYWGYNFALESDGNTFNRYYLKSVEVRKLGKAAQ